MVKSRGFTLLEAVMVITITGIIAAMIATFMVMPINAYRDTVNRATLVELADTALRRLGRDLRTAVPNSVRVSGTFLEFLPTSAGGRYRAGLPGNLLDFDANGSGAGFDVLGPAAGIAVGDFLVVFNTGQCSNATCTGIVPCLGANAYEGCNRRTVAAPTTAGASLGYAPDERFPFSSPSLRFQVIPAAQQAVTYGCTGVGVNANGDGTGSLLRYWGYGFAAAQATPPAGAGLASAVLATNLSGCAITYTPANERDGLVSIVLQLERNFEVVSLHHEIHVDNQP